MNVDAYAKVYIKHHHRKVPQDQAIESEQLENIDAAAFDRPDPDGPTGGCCFASPRCRNPVC